MGAGASSVWCNVSDAVGQGEGAYWLEERDIFSPSGLGCICVSAVGCILVQWD